MTALPQAFVAQMAEVLGEELTAFLASYEEPYHRGLRRNPFKQPTSGLGAWVQGLEAPIPWEENGCYLALESLAGSHPLHEGGSYYLQEPSAMIPAAVLNPQPGERVLDLCAAPGGKSTQLAVRLQGQGLLVANEPVPSRAQILSRNLERMGVPNSLVVSAMPDALARKWSDFFDAIMVDAPCSGEGMFRRHPETRAEWTPQSPEGCAKRQWEILCQAAKMLRPGGRLCYATCTLNRIENDEMIRRFLEEHPEFELQSIRLNGLPENEGMLHIYPHQVKGEGHFAALLHKKGDGKRMPASCTGLKPVTKEALQAMQAFHKGLNASGMLGDTLFQLTEWPDVKGIKVLRAGLHLGQQKGKVFAPDHALATVWGENNFPVCPVEEETARRYLKGETFDCDKCGWHVITLDGVSLGWGKASDGIMKNHYPKGLRNGK